MNNVVHIHVASYTDILWARHERAGSRIRLLTSLKHAYAAKLICSTGASKFQNFKLVFCMYNKLCLHALILSQ